METIWYDAKARLVRFRRLTRITNPDGSLSHSECIQERHPVSIAETIGWTEQAGLHVRSQFGDYDRSPCTATSNRVIVWAEKTSARGP
jgi:hypothetical protein